MVKNSKKPAKILKVEKRMSEKSENNYYFHNKIGKAIPSSKFLFENESGVNVQGHMTSKSIMCKEKILVDEGISTQGWIRAKKIVTRSIKAPFFEGAMVNRFVNNTGISLNRGDVVLLAISTFICPGNTGEITIFLEAVSSENAEDGILAGVVVGNEDIGADGYDDILPEKVGFACINGIFPMVKVDSFNFTIDKGMMLIVGPMYKAVPSFAAEILGILPVKLGMALSCAEEGDSYVPVLIQPSRGLT